MHYGENDYRFWTHISKNDLTATISQATGITADHFEIIDSADFKGYSYF